MRQPYFLGGYFMKLYDTVAAISTPHGKGGVAMIRITGNDAVSVADKIFKRKNGAVLDKTKSSLMVYGEIIDRRREETVDDGMAVVFRAPYSFTGEDTVEIYCHGGVLVTRKVLSLALSEGARMAEAGEFTRRAFLSGKMGLSEAEALGALLDAGSDAQLRLARGGMRGHLARRTGEIYEELRAIMAGIYAAIDFPDEDLNEYSRQEIYNTVKNARQDVTRLAATYGTGRAVSEGISTVICGKTNAGKSSVYNRILGYDAAIVTDIKGTTRDILRERATLGDTTLMLCDTAGLRETDDKVESIGIGRALDAIEEAELVLAVFDASLPLDADDELLIDKLCSSDKTVVALLNKSDLAVNSGTKARITGAFRDHVSVCADNGDGFDALARLVDGLFIDGTIDISNDAVVTGARQYAALISAEEALSEALSALEGDVPLDICCVGIEAAMSSVAMLDGREIGEDIVSEIFSKFCVGK